MFDCFNEACAPEVKSEETNAGQARFRSFKTIRKVRKKNRLKRSLEKKLALKNKVQMKPVREKSFPGPTPETLARLTEDPLVHFKKRNILNDEQLSAFKRIRRAVQIITDGTQVRVSRFNDVVVQASCYGDQTESEYEIKIKEQYTHWIDRMTTARLAAGPVLDVIIDEMSLSAVDRKWGKRKGWAKGHLQASLVLYGASSAVFGRNR